MNKKIAIILLNWNNYQDTYDCLKSLEGISEPIFDIFLVDNNSTDGSYELLKKYKETKKVSHTITYIQANENLGFAGGNNLGLKVAYSKGYEFFWLLNNDTIVNPDALKNLYNTIVSDKSIGIVGSKIYYYSDPKRIWFAGGKINTWTGTPTHIGENQYDSMIYNEQKSVDYITGCSLFFRRQVLDTVGYMYEDFFLYYEETEWNIRINNYGWKIIYEPKSVVFHKVSASSGGTENIAPYVEYYDIRNAYIMIKRTQPNFKVIFAAIYMFVKICKNAIKTLLFKRKNKNERAWYNYRGVLDAFFMRMGKHPKR
ncbi:glycosyltransferase family 2 protein [Niallia circulans]|uniref:glycosyltransferase family 2 protein n=1 Tax=Niallia circulans TaxID=1397 RepID=UPI000AA4757A|nr:glycosyltransferase family 2 protein [Niallia circulans]